MFFYHDSLVAARPFSNILRSFQNIEGLPFADVLSEKDIRGAFAAADCRFGEGEHDVFTPAVTLWAFLSQTLFAGSDRSCDAAVLRIRQMLTLQGKSACAFNSGGYCKARAKIDESVPQSLLRIMADRAEEKAKSAWTWNGRKHVYFVDGTEVSGPDTAENQDVYPQSGNQAEGCGFPLMRCVVLTSFTTAMVRSVAIGPHHGKGTGETALFRGLIETIPAGSVVVGDRYHCSYFAFAELRKKGIDVVTRATNFRLAALGKRDTFTRLKNGDLLVTWHKPKRLGWMNVEEYQEVPDTLSIRLTEVYVREKGSRVRHLHVVTTLLDTDDVSSKSLANLYKKRWHVELDLRSIKTMMGLDILRGKTPHMMRLELFVGLLAYNLIRLTILNSAAVADGAPRNISFTAAKILITTDWSIMLFLPSTALYPYLMSNLRALTKHCVGHRGGRLEPRVVKRRPKAFPRQQEPRESLRKKLVVDYAIKLCV